MKTKTVCLSVTNQSMKISPLWIKCVCVYIVNTRPGIFILSKMLRQLCLVTVSLMTTACLKMIYCLISYIYGCQQYLHIWIDCTCCFYDARNVIFLCQQSVRQACKTGHFLIFAPMKEGYALHFVSVYAQFAYAHQYTKVDVCNGHTVCVLEISREECYHRNRTTSTTLEHGDPPPSSLTSCHSPSLYPSSLLPFFFLSPDTLTG